MATTDMPEKVFEIEIQVSPTIINNTPNVVKTHKVSVL